jgi:hypothetical protein
MKDEERTRCEIFSRIVGYIRPTAQWNQGKKSEWSDRKVFKSSNEKTKKRRNSKVS